MRVLLCACPPAGQHSTPPSACPQSELPVGMRVLRVRGGAATVAAAGGQYTARLTLVPSPRDDVIATKYRPPGEAEEAAGRHCCLCIAGGCSCLLAQCAGRECLCLAHVAVLCLTLALV